MANSQSFADPVAISKLTAQALGLEMIDLRRGLGALSAPAPGNTFGTTSGVFPGGTSGPGISNDLQGFTAGGMGATYNGGHYGADRGNGNLYLGMAYAANTVTHTVGDATNPRIDYVVIRNRDPGVDANVTESAKLVILPGTPAAVPVEPTAQLTAGDVLLSATTVARGATSLTQDNISDRRLFIVARGAIVPRPSWDTRDGAYEGQYGDNLATDGLERWSGSKWEQVASPAVWSAFTPALFSDAGQASLGTGGSAYGRYISNGKILDFRMEFRASRPCNLGYGGVYTKLPTGFTSAAQRESHVQCKLNLYDAIYDVYFGDALIQPNDNKVYPSFPPTTTDVRLRQYKVATQSGVAGASVPVVPGGFADPYILNISGRIEIQ